MHGLGLLLLAGCLDSCRITPDADDTDAATSDDTSSATDTQKPDDTADDSGTPTPGACGSGTPGGWQPPVHTVIVLVPDGTRIDESLGDLSSTVTGEATVDFWPEIRDRLLAHGAEVLPGYATGVPITGEGHAAMVTGRRDPQANFPSDWGPGLYRPEYPTLFEAVRQTYGTDEASVALVSNTVHLGGHTWGLYPTGGEDVGAEFDFLVDEDDIPIGDDVAVIRAVQHHMEDGDVRFILANLHQIDRSGHYNANPQAYAENVKLVDTPIADFWDWIQSTEPYKDDTVLVVMADHGRHRWGSDEDFRNHGDHCAGCRQIPMLFVGAGVGQGVAVEQPMTIEDAGATIGWLLGVPMPYATGQIACELLENPPEDRGRSGIANYARSGSLTAWQTWNQDAATKSSVVVDGETLSREGAIHAEAPRVLQTDDLDFVCWRQLYFEPAPFDTVDTWPWTAECRQRDRAGGDWIDVGFPTSPVNPYFDTSLASDAGGRIWLAYGFDETGNWEAPEQVLRVLRKTQSGDWEGGDMGRDTMALPLYPSLSLIDDTAYVAITTSEEQLSAAEKKRGRYTRHIEVYKVDWPVGGTQEWTKVYWTDTAMGATGDTGTTDDHPYGRMDRPALTALDDELAVAFIAYSPDNSTTIAWSHTTDSAATWSDVQAIDDTGRVLGVVTPDWSTDGWLYYTRLADSDTVEVCRVSLDDTVPDCQTTPWAYADSLEATPTGVTVVVAQGDKAWQSVDFKW